MRDKPNWVEGAGAPEGEIRKTNPIPAPAADRAKRTQFGLGWAGPGSERRKMQNEPNSWRHRAGRGYGGVGRGAKVQNEPNFATSGRNRAGTPNPRSGRGRLYEEPIAQNKAKLGQDGASGGRRVREGSRVRNEPNFRLRRVGRGRRGDEGERCKTNPIRPLEDGGREPVLSLPKERPPHEEPSGTKCAERTQFPGVPAAPRRRCVRFFSGATLFLCLQ